MEEKKVNLSIIILSYNSKTDLERLLPSIVKAKDSLNVETIIIDNGSADSSADWIAAQISNYAELNLKLIRNSNSGFARGNNLGIKIARGEYLLILNPDTRLEPDVLKAMHAFMENQSGIGIATCKVVLPDGRLDLACRRRFPNPVNSFKRLFLRNNRDYNLIDSDENRETEIDACMGAFMFIRRPGGNLSKLELFDEDFFMYGEDIDLCWRFKQMGMKVWYYPKVFITHFKGSSSAKMPFKALKWFHDAMWIFYKKHYAADYPFLFNRLVFVGIYLRLGALVFLNLFKKNPKVSG